MSLQLGSLYVSLTARTDGYMKSMAGALKVAEKFARETKRIAAEVAQASAVFAGLGGAALHMAAAVDGPTKNAMAGLERSTKLLAVQVADMLLPAVRELTSMFRSAAGVVAGLDPEVKKHISSFAVLAVQIAVVAKVLSVFAGIAGNVFGVLRAGFAAVAAVGLGPLLEIAVVVGAVIAVVVLLHRAWRKNWGGIQEATTSVLEWFRSAFSQLADFFGGVWDFLVDGASRFIEAILTAVDALQELTGKKLIDTGGLREGFAGMFKDLKSGSFFSEAFKFGKSIGAQIVEGLGEELSAIKKELGLDKLLAGPKQGATIGLGRGMGPKGPLVSGAVMPQFGGISAGGQWLHEMERLEKDTKKHNDLLSKARDLELHSRLAIASDLARQKTIAGAIQSGTVSSLTGDTRKQAEAQMGGTMDAAVNAGSWAEAQQILSAGLQGSMDVGKSLAVWGARMGPMIWAAGKQMLGAVGDLVDSIAQGAEKGGVWGALIAAFMEIAKKTQSALKFLDVAMEFVKQIAAMVEPLVAPIFDALTNLLGGIIEMIGPLFQALQPLFDGLAKFIDNLGPVISGIGYVLDAISPVIEVVAKVIGGILQALKPVLDLIGGILKVVATVVLGIIIGLNEIAAAFGDEAAKAESARLKGIVDKMWSPGVDERDAADRAAAAATLRNASAQDQAAQAAQKAAENLTNVPSGYKVALARYGADLGMSNPLYAGGAGGDGGTTINGDVYVTSSATTVNSLAQDAAKEARRERGQERGNPSRGRGGEN